MTDDNTDTDTTTFDDVFKQWLSHPEQASQLDLLDSPGRTLAGMMLERAFMAGASVGVQAQAHADESQLTAALAQRDFLDIVCMSSDDSKTRNWRSGFNTTCPPELLWPSKSGGDGQGDDAFGWEEGGLSWRIQRSDSMLLDLVCQLRATLGQEHRPAVVDDMCDGLELAPFEPTLATPGCYEDLRRETDRLIEALDTLAKTVDDEGKTS